MLLKPERIVGGEFALRAFFFGIRFQFYPLFFGKLCSQSELRVPVKCIFRGFIAYPIFLSIILVIIDRICSIICP